MRFFGGGPGRQVAYVRLLWAGPLAGLVAALFNVTVFLGASAVGIMSQEIVVPGRGPITLGAVASVSFVPAILGAGLLALVGLLTRRPVGTFAVVAAAVLVLSFVPPFTLPGVPAAMIMALLLMHLVAATTIVFLLVTLATRERRKVPRP